MDLKSAPKSKWLASSGKIKHVVRLQNINDPGGGDKVSIRQKVRKFYLIIKAGIIL